MTIQVSCSGMMGAGLSLYVLLGGADFGGGVWDLLATGPRAPAIGRSIADAIAPVWEANHVWLIFVLTGLFAAFPQVFADLSVALYLPFSLVLLGIVLRGAAFAFRAHGDDARVGRRVDARVRHRLPRVAVPARGVGGVDRERPHPGRRRRGAGRLVSAWTAPLSIFAGAVRPRDLRVPGGDLPRGRGGRSRRRRARARLPRPSDRQRYRGRVLAAVGLFVVRGDAPVLWTGMLERAWPFVAASALAGSVSLAAMVRRAYRPARVASAVAVAAVLWGWGAAQWPYLIVPDVTAGDAAAPPGTMRVVAIGFTVGGLLLAPSLFLLFRVFKTAEPAPHA